MKISYTNAKHTRVRVEFAGMSWDLPLESPDVQDMLAREKAGELTIAPYEPPPEDPKGDA